MLACWPRSAQEAMVRWSAVSAHLHGGGWRSGAEEEKEEREEEETGRPRRAPPMLPQATLESPFFEWEDEAGTARDDETILDSAGSG